MPHTHHTHSGQFCPGHARNTLESMIQRAISHSLTVFAVTEHMPRHDVDLYPEELSSKPPWNLDRHFANESAFYAEAVRLRQKYHSRIELLIGFESEWIRPESLTLIQRSLKAFDFDFFVGSVHHVHTIPIDYSAQEYERAREKAGGTDERLFEDYFDWQLEMLKALRPPVVGHFDLIRLKSEDPNGSFQRYSGVWKRIVRNLDFVRDHDGVVEINSSALRKGLSEPYPKGEVCEAFLQMGGKFCLSDDSHGVEEVALNYDKVLEFVMEVGIRELCFFQLKEGERLMTIQSVKVDAIREHPSWVKQGKALAASGS